MSHLGECWKHTQCYHFANKPKFLAENQQAKYTSLGLVKMANSAEGAVIAVAD